jgi:hypothetical protein
MAYDFPDGPRNWKIFDVVPGLILGRHVQADRIEEVLLTMVEAESYYAVNAPGSLRGWLPSRSQQHSLALPTDHLNPYNTQVAAQLRQNPYTADFPRAFDEGFEWVRTANAHLNGDGIPPQTYGPHFRTME